MITPAAARQIARLHYRTLVSLRTTTDDDERERLRAVSDRANGMISAYLRTLPGAMMSEAKIDLASVVCGTGKRTNG